MKIWNHGLSWHDEHRWYVRGGLVIWWLGQFLFSACLAVAVAVLVLSGFETRNVDSALGCLLAGLVILITTGWTLAMARRRRRRRHARVY